MKARSQQAQLADIGRVEQLFGERVEGGREGVKEKEIFEYEREMSE